MYLGTAGPSFFFFLFMKPFCTPPLFAPGLSSGWVLPPPDLVPSSLVVAWGATGTPPAGSVPFRFMGTGLPPMYFLFLRTLYSLSLIGTSNFSRISTMAVLNTMSQKDLFLATWGRFWPGPGLQSVRVRLIFYILDEDTLNDDKKSLVKKFEVNAALLMLLG